MDGNIQFTNRNCNLLRQELYIMHQNFFINLGQKAEPRKTRKGTEKLYQYLLYSVCSVLLVVIGSEVKLV